MWAGMKFTKNCEKQCKKHTKTPKAIQAQFSSKNTKMNKIHTKIMKKQLESLKILKARNALCSGKITENCANITFFDDKAQKVE